MLVIVALAVLVTLFVAYPNRGQAIPHASWLSSAMVRMREKLIRLGR